MKNPLSVSMYMSVHLVSKHWQLLERLQSGKINFIKVKMVKPVLFIYLEM